MTRGTANAIDSFNDGVTMTVCPGLNFFLLLSVFAVALMPGCTQPEAKSDSAVGPALGGINETGVAQPLEKLRDADLGGLNSSVSGLPSPDCSNASEQEGGLCLITTNQERANETRDAPLLVSIVSFSADKPIRSNWKTPVDLS